jgi:hypothetical protein
LQQQLARQDALEAYVSLHAEKAKLKDEFKKRDVRYSTEALTARHRPALNAERAINVKLSARNKALNNTVAQHKRAEQKHITREHLKVVKNRRVEEEIWRTKSPRRTDRLAFISEQRTHMCMSLTVVLGKIQR